MASRTRKSDFVPNPSWVTDAITGSYEKMQDMLPDTRWLPRLQDVHTTGASNLEASVNEYGCGVYGCVFPTMDPSTVLKVTSDDTEAQFAATLANDLVRPICVEYRLVLGLAAEYKGGRIHLIWRESADQVGRIGDVLGPEALDYITYQHEKAQLAYLAIHRMDEPSEIYGLVTDWLNACERMARQTRVPGLRELGDGLVEVYGAQRVFFGDVHQGNLGLVTRGERQHWVITDPGHVAIVDL